MPSQVRFGDDLFNIQINKYFYTIDLELVYFTLHDPLDPLSRTDLTYYFIRMLGFIIFICNASDNWPTLCDILDYVPTVDIACMCLSLDKSILLNPKAFAKC